MNHKVTCSIKLLLEILTGKPSYDQRRGPSETDLVTQQARLSHSIQLHVC